LLQIRAIQERQFGTSGEWIVLSSFAVQQGDSVMSQQPSTAALAASGLSNGLSKKERRSVPAAAIQLYNDYIHGEIDRRTFLNGMQQFAAAGLSTSALVAALMPDYAMGQQIARDDERIRAEYVTVPSPNGYGEIRGYLVRPFSADSR